MLQPKEIMIEIIMGWWWRRRGVITWLIVYGMDVFAKPKQKNSFVSHGLSKKGLSWAKIFSFDMKKENVY